MIGVVILILLSMCLQGTKGEDENFISFGCWGGEKKSRDRQREIGKLMGKVAKENGVRYAVAAGDNFYRKGVQTTMEDRWRETFLDVYPEEVKFHVALGNHDYRGDIWAQVNYTKINPARWNLPYPYHTVVENGVKLVFIDTVLLERCVVNKDKPKLYKARCWDNMLQWAWMQEELLKDFTGWKVVVGHYPLHANGPHENKKWLVDMLCPLFTVANVSLYINADNHYMQYSLYEGVYYLNSGGGAGYMPHTPHDKGYRVSLHSLWHFFADGIFLHRTTPTYMIISAHTPAGMVHNITIPNRNNKGAVFNLQTIKQRVQNSSLPPPLSLFPLSPPPLQTGPVSFYYYYYLIVFLLLLAVLFYTLLKRITGSTKRRR
eukprot:TRINITY_DN1181_c3_g1_i3.p1 TRINITY_DN1181_c3_g1~~TRINITY_DN1181_c3_g1_i3.p1  ORF type:complete len:375 (+),score=68.35 TRINITY_DN1181_c3_g1_i3:51-1175(+)